MVKKRSCFSGKVFYDAEKNRKKTKRIYKRYIGSFDPFGNDHYCDVIFVDEIGREVSEVDYWNWVNEEDQ